MKPEKVEWFKNALDRMNSPIKVIKLMYDLLLSGEGHAVVGSKSSMNPNSYRQRFGESDVAESAKPGEYYVHTVYFKDGTKKRVRVTSDEVDVADYYNKRGQAVDRVDYDFQLHSDMTESEATKTRLDPKCWSGKKIGTPKTKVKGGVRVNNCVPAESIQESYWTRLQNERNTKIASLVNELKESIEKK
jgi:hypothetical protein